MEKQTDAEVQNKFVKRLNHRSKALAKVLNHILLKLFRIYSYFMICQNNYELDLDSSEKSQIEPKTQPTSIKTKTADKLLEHLFDFGSSVAVKEKDVARQIILGNLPVSYDFVTVVTRGYSPKADVSQKDFKITIGKHNFVYRVPFVILTSFVDTSIIGMDEANVKLVSQLVNLKEYLKVNAHSTNNYYEAYGLLSQGQLNLYLLLVLENVGNPGEFLSQIKRTHSSKLFELTKYSKMIRKVDERLAVTCGDNMIEEIHLSESCVSHVCVNDENDDKGSYKLSVIERKDDIIENPNDKDLILEAGTLTNTQIVKMIIDVDKKHTKATNDLKKEMKDLKKEMKEGFDKVNNTLSYIMSYLKIPVQEM